MSIQSGSHSLSALSNQFFALTGQSVSKEGLNKRMNSQRHEDYCRCFLQQILDRELSQQQMGDQMALSTFGRVLLEDSTTLKLPSNLAEAFPGSYSRGKRPTACARIQYCTDLKTMTTLALDLQAYRDNDQKHACAILSHLQANDLVLRDLGYFTLDSLSKISQKAAFFISRYKAGVNVYTHDDEQLIDLLSLARQHCRRATSSFECQVKLGAAHRLPLRLVIEKLPRTIYRERLRKAKRERHSKANHSAAYYELLKWSIMLTNVPAQRLSAPQLRQVYELRWRIEIIFKVWKSGIGIQQYFLHKNRINVHRCKMTIYLFLAYIMLVLTPTYHRVSELILEQFDKHLSIVKWTDFILSHLQPCCAYITEQQILQHLARNCCYESRPDRINFAQKFYRS